MKSILAAQKPKMRIIKSMLSYERARRLEYLGLGLLCCMILRYVYISLEYRQNKIINNMRTEQYQSKTQESLAFRGEIFDRGGHPLAINAQKYSLFINPMEFKPNAKEISRLENFLGKKLPSPAKQGKGNLKGKEKGRFFRWVKRHMAEEPPKDLLRIKGLYLREEMARDYPQGKIASSLLGMVGTDRKGLYGLERHFEGTLGGGERFGEKVLSDARGRLLYTYPEKSPLLGKDLHLTLDLYVQSIIEKHLSEGVRHAKAKRGFALFAHPHLGEILGVSTFVENQNSIENAPFTSLFEPGSVIKPFIIAKALDEEAIFEHTLLDCTKMGVLKVSPGLEIHDDHPLGIGSTRDILTYSSNICTYKIASMLGKEKTLGTLGEFGFFSRGLLGAFSKTGRVEPLPWSDIRFANISFGQGFFTSALEITQAYALLAAQGRFIPLRLLRDKYTLPSKQVIKPSTARILGEILSETVEKGTGQKARSLKFKIAGKTGTAQKFDLITRTYPKNMRIASFAGFAPALDPLLVGYVVIDEPQNTPYYGGLWAAPIFKKIAEEVIPYLLREKERKYTAH